MNKPILKQRSKGFFITLEGGEGSGKSSLARYLKGLFLKEGYEVVLTREPGGCPFAEKLRSLVLKTEEPISAKAELLLFLSARSEHINSIIAPAINRGAVVICDRFTDSTLAYQGYARGLGVDEILPICQFAECFQKPNRSYLLDVDPETGFQRIKRRASTDRIEKAGLDFHKKVREGFLKLSKMFPERIVVINANEDKDQVFKNVVLDIREHF